MTNELPSQPFATFVVHGDGDLLLQAPVSGEVTIGLALSRSLSSLEFRLVANGRPFDFRGFDIRAEQEEAPVADAPIPRRSALEEAWCRLHAERTLPATATGPWGEDSLLGWEREIGPCHEIDVGDEQTRQRNAAELALYGLSVAALRWAGDRRVQAECELLRQLGRGRTADLLASGAGLAEPRRDGLFLAERQSGDGVDQISSILSGSVSCVSPFTGEMLTTRHAFAVDSCGLVFLFYHFEQPDGRTFYLVCGGYNQRRLFLYIASANLMLKIGNQTGVWGPIRESVRLFRRLMVGQVAEVERYLASGTTPVLLNGCLSNLGHYFWNEVTGMVRFQAAGGLGCVRHCADYRYKAIDACAMLGGVGRLASFSTPDDLFKGAVQGSMFPVRLTSIGGDPETSSAICDFATQSLSFTEQDLIKEAQQSDLFVFFNLRAHNKMWLEQVDGAVLLAKRAAEKGLSLSLYLDGLPDCASSVERIIAGAGNTARIYLGIEKTVSETIAWAAACDAYLATVGSGLALLTWLAGKPGVAHAEQHHLGQRSWWSDVRPDAPPPVFVDPDWVTSFGEDSYSNYSIDPERVVELFWQSIVNDRAAGIAGSGDPGFVLPEHARTVHG